MARETEVLASPSVLDGGQPVLRVLLDRDGVLRCTVGAEDADVRVAFGDLLASDDCLGHLPRLYRGFYAERDAVGEPWRREHEHDHLHPDETEEDERTRIEERIAATGWYCLQVAGTEEDSGGTSDFAYTVGLRDTFDGHPDLIVFDRDLDAAYGILDSVVDELRAGRRLRRGDTSTEVLQGSEVRFCGAPVRVRTELMTFTDWLYDREPFDALQVVWPDTEDRWPWEEGSRGSYQPVLARDDPWCDPEASDTATKIEADGATWVTWVGGELGDATMTLGLEATFGHPELLLRRMDDAAFARIEALSEEIRAGATLDLPAVDDAIHAELAAATRAEHALDLGRLVEVNPG